MHTISAVVRKIFGMARIRVLFAFVLASVAVQALCGTLRRRFDVPGNWKRSEIGGTRVPNFRIGEELPPFSAANFSIFNGEGRFRSVRVHIILLLSMENAANEFARFLNRYAPPP